MTSLSPVDGLAQLSFLVSGLLERRGGGEGPCPGGAPPPRAVGGRRAGEPTMNELARLLELDKSSVTGLVDRAERRGLVARAPSAADRRSVLVRLTHEGRGLVSATGAGL